MIPRATIVAAKEDIPDAWVHVTPGEILRPVQAYLDDSNQLWPKIDRFDKLERIQHFREPYDASWRAFAAGRREESRELSEQNRPAVVAEFAEDARLGYRSYRVRVVELPGSLAMYGVLYDGTGELAGGRRFTDPELIAGCRAEVQAPHATGEDFWTFFEREIAPLPPPAVHSEPSRFAGS